MGSKFYYKIVKLNFRMSVLRSANLHANHKQSLTGATTLLVKIFKYYGNPGELPFVLKN